MPSAELDRLVAAKTLESEAPIREEFDGLLREAALALHDAKLEQLSVESRFRLAYAAAHSLALAALRWHGYRPRNRQIVFQALAHTLGTPTPIWKMLSQAHARRNRVDYEGTSEVDARLVKDIIDACDRLLIAVKGLPPFKERS